MKTKLHRGGQTGNQNARKHGLYSPTLSPTQMLILTNDINAGGQDPALIALRLKLVSALKSAPHNRRVLMEASKILGKWYVAKYGVNQKDKAIFKYFICAMLKELMQNRNILTERTEAENRERIPCSAVK